MKNIYLTSILILVFFLTVSQCQVSKKDPIKVVNSIKGGSLHNNNQSFTTVSNTNTTTNTSSNNTTPKVNQIQYYFHAQILDHFNPLDDRVFTQRYWIIDQFYDQKNGPIFLYICGEWTCNGADGYPVYLAEQFNGLVITLEHRYYGASQPFGLESMKTDLMKYLTVENALEDLAYFINFVKSNQVGGINPVAPWITIGGSYPGALSAWFRSKYPYLTVGALASSAVVHPILNFYQYDQQVGKSTAKSGDWCPQGIQNITQYIQSLLTDPASNIKVKQDFNSQNISDGLFMYYIADIYAALVQYGQREFLCNKLIQNKTIDEMYQAVLNYSNSNQSITYQEGIQLGQVSNTTYDINNANRQWTYQTCTQFGWWQTAPANDSIRSQMVNLTTFQQMCIDAFTSSNYWPNTTYVKLALGSTGIQATNLIMVNGGEDPWQWASVRQNQGSILAYVADCNDCGHCVDLGTPKSTDPVQLQYIHNQTQFHMKEWIQDYWTKYYIKQLKMKFKLQ